MVKRQPDRATLVDIREQLALDLRTERIVLRKEMMKMVKVLYVEDEPLQRELINQLLQLAGLEIQLAENGMEGVEKARAWKPDVILMDVRMPGLSGFETIEQIKKSPALADTPVIVLSAWATAQHTAHAKELGVKWYITKPFNLDDLVNTIMEAYGSCHEA